VITYGAGMIIKVVPVHNPAGWWEERLSVYEGAGL
jgi:hypothetical protein